MEPDLTNRSQPVRRDADPQGDRAGPLRRHRGWLLVAVGIAVAFGLFHLWKDHVEDRVIPKRWGVVRPNHIYRSGQLSESLVHRMLEKHGIEVIIDLTDRDSADPDEAAELDAVRRLGIDHGTFPLAGHGKGDPRVVRDALLRLHEAVSADEPVLVHCAAGAHRTGGVIAVWRLLVDGWSRDAVIDEMAAYNWRRRDKHGLLRYLDENMARFASALHAAGAIDTVPDPLPRLGDPEPATKP